ncbi:MAG: peptidoglycan DD-metalloendopeptidase family protein [Coleofasciculaceae cyanobacterium RL_1_1]|nr:peptidoglycan DD-metalloendopeptidase family protein [Coleofasciculaceae cyanobacterium RL_1_1]
MTKPVCGEGQRRVRTSAAAIGLAISMGAATMALPKPSNASVISESNNETRNASNEKQPETYAFEGHLESDDHAVNSEVTAPTDGLASALMVPSIDKTAVIPDEALPNPVEPEAVETTETAVAPDTAVAEPRYLQYTVRRNQTLWQIASAYRISLEEVAQANGISADAALYVGQVLNIPIHDGMNRRPEFDVIADASEFTASRKTLDKAIDVRGYSNDEHDDASAPVSDHVAYVAPLLNDASKLDSTGEFDPSTPRNNPEQTATTLGTPHRALISRLSPSFEELAPQSEMTFVPSVLNTRSSVVHRVAPGETLSSVASRHGVNLEALIAANSIANPDNLQPGQELVVPSSSSSTSLLRGSIAALPSGTTDTESISGIVAPNTPRVAAPASRISAVSRRDRSFESSLNSHVVSATTPASPSLVTEPSMMAAATTTTVESSPSIDYATSLRDDIERLRLQTPVSAVANTRDSVNIAAVSTPLDIAHDTDRSFKPDQTREMASLRVNPEFSARDSVREASTAATSGKLATEENAISGVVATPSPAPLMASSDVGGVGADEPDTVAVAPLGSSNYAPVLPPRSVSPDIPALAAVGEYLPTVGAQFNGYIWPAQGVLTSGYGWRWGRMHNGIDIGAPTGTPIVAAAPGVVTYARWNSGGYGNLVEVTHPDGSLTLYAHNNRIVVEEGEQVEQGQHIADMGSTGFSTGPHLHFELHSAGQGVVNPIAYLP